MKARSRKAICSFDRGSNEPAAQCCRCVAQALSGDGFPASVPKAICGPNDHAESGLQGETTMEERFSGDSETAAKTAICNSWARSPQDTNTKEPIPRMDRAYVRRMCLLWNGQWLYHWPRHQGDRRLRPPASGGHRKPDRHPRGA